MSTRTLTFNGRKFRVAKQSFDAGGQGQVYEAEDIETGFPAIYKTLTRDDDKNADGQKRLAYQIESQLALNLPQTCAPIISRHKGGDLGYLTLRAPGVILEQDRPRKFPERLETAWILACHWSRWEALGLAHGDIGLTNIMIDDAGTVSIIDTDAFSA